MKMFPQKKACNTCPFEGKSPLALPPEKLTEIINYLGEGQNHICHNSQNKICRGGRNLQLKIFTAQGFIDKPTDEALAEAMKANGVKPKIHINGHK